MRALLAAIALGLPAVVQAQPADHGHMNHEHVAPAAQAPTPPAERDGHNGHAAPARPQGHDHSPGEEPALATPTMDPHAGHSATTEPVNPPVGTPPAEALGGPAHAADQRFAPADMTRARAAMIKGHGAIQTHKVMIDELEWRSQEGADGYAWEGQAWFGGDTDRLWFKSKGEGEFRGRLEKIEAQALWSHAIGPWFNLELGLRQDFRAGPDRTYATAGVQGLAPYWFEMSAAAFLSNKGELTARIEADYDLRLTQRLILQPRVQLDLAAQDVPDLRLGSGMATAELGLRLRYEIVPELAPYVGLYYEGAIGRTADLRRAGGDDAETSGLIAGIRLWF